MTVTDRTDATEQEFRARIAAFEGAPYPSEVAIASVLAYCDEIDRAELFPGLADTDAIRLRLSR